MIEVTFDVQGHLASTLDPEYLGTHNNGWTINGEVHEDYYTWVNEFEAVHLIFGRVWGNFEYTVYADTREGYSDFVNHFPVSYWDYWDI